MTPEQFCFWLHGFFELTGRDALTEAQAKMVREHLDLVFTKVTPPLKDKRELLNDEIERARHARPGRICDSGKGT